jgi:hypothetical protein
MIAVVLGAALFFTADPTPPPVPVSPLTLLNVAVPELPEIGRVRATTPSCAILHDLLIPSFLAAKRADDRFATISTAGPAYAGGASRDVGEENLSFESRYGSDEARQLSHMDQALSVMLRERKNIETALSDPRFAANADDPKVAEEQKQLRTLLDAQGQRASLLNEFVTRENMFAAKQDVVGGNGLGVGGRRGQALSAPAPTRATPAPEGMPDLHKQIPENDALQMITWYRSLNLGVHAAEFTAATSFLNQAKECK